MLDQVNTETGELTRLSYDTSRLADFGDFVSAGIEELQKRDRSTWALGDIAAALEIREGRPSGRDETIPTLSDLAREWGVTHGRVSLWRSNALFWNCSYRNSSTSWTDANVLRLYVEWEQKGQDYEVKFERALEILDEATGLALRGAALEMWLKDKRHAVQNSFPLPPGKYQVIYADPPWEYGNTMPEEKRMGQEFHYQTMTVAEITAMPIATLAHDNAVLFLWVTSPILEEAFEVVRSWGFEYKSSYVWHKEGASVLAHYNDMRHELLLVCVRGSFMPVEPMRFKSVVSIPKSKRHSEKPHYFRQMIEQLYPDAVRVELFARETFEGWAAYGNELQEA